MASPRSRSTCRRPQSWPAPARGQRGQTGFEHPITSDDPIADRFVTRVDRSSVILSDRQSAAAATRWISAYTGRKHGPFSRVERAVLYRAQVLEPCSRVGRDVERHAATLPSE
jgi:hypothetical protein